MNKKFILIAIAAIIISFFLDTLASDAMLALWNPFFDTVFSWFGHFGSLFAILIIMTSLFLWEEKKGKWIKPLWLSFAFALVFVYLIKFAIARARPDEIVLLVPFTHIIDFSFPSAHAAAAFAPVVILDREYPKLKLFWIVFAIMVAISRVYLGFHHLSDVVTGIVIGLSSGMLFVYITEKKCQKKKKR
ncbi:MAG: phosphatase PAP2 family protein [bacterium]|nr:phosphatase PAP2 family protein [bacterium]